MQAVFLLIGVIVIFCFALELRHGLHFRNTPGISKLLKKLPQEGSWTYLLLGLYTRPSAFNFSHLLILYIGLIVVGNMEILEPPRVRSVAWNFIILNNKLQKQGLQ